MTHDAAERLPELDEEFGDYGYISGPSWVAYRRTIVPVAEASPHADALLLALVEAVSHSHTGRVADDQSVQTALAAARAYLRQKAAA